MSEQTVSLKKSWAIQRRVIYALLMREVLTRYGRHNIGFLWLFVEPMLFTLGVTAIWSFAKATHSSSLPIVAFAVTGYSSVLLWRNMPGRCINAISPNLSLMYHRNVKVIDIYVSRLLLEVFGATASFVFLSLFFISIGWMKAPENVLLVFLAWCMLSWFGFSLALVLGALSEESEVIEKVWNPASYLLFPLSGAAFLVDVLPPTAQKFVLILPMVHGVEMLRDGYFGLSIRTHYSIQYMSIICVALTIIGFALERRISRKVMPE